jgi:DNA-binding winged helix-turn-helix (wHTH) protein
VLLFPGRGSTNGKIADIRVFCGRWWIPFLRYFKVKDATGALEFMREFPPFRLDSVNQCLWRRCERAEDQRILLTPKAYAVLLYLVDRAGRLVTQNELLEAIWPDTFVQPEVLKYQIADIRAALGDSARKPSFIETLPRRGYRFIAAVHEEGSPPAAIGDRGSRLVGRKRELASLRQSFARVLKGERQLIFITGELGIGKTALVEEFVSEASAAEPSLRIAHAHTVGGTGVSESFYPVLDAVNQLCRGPDGAELVELLAQYAPTWLVQFPALIKPEERETLRPEIIGATRSRMLREIRGALDGFAAEKPVLYIFEDVHWLDPSSLDLLSAFAHDRAQAKVMVIFTMRSPERMRPDDPLQRMKQDLLLHHLGFEIRLGPLSEAEVAAYLASDSPSSSLPEGLAGLVYRRSEGNPLFMIATLDRMLEKGQATREKGVWNLTLPIDQIDLEVPETLRQMIEGQIDHLSIEEQRALEAASVAGTSFSANFVSRVAGIDPDRLLELFETVSRRSRFIRPGPSQQLDDGTIVQLFEFVHALYRDVFYWRQTPARRASIQDRIGAGQK